MMVSRGPPGSTGGPAPPIETGPPPSPGPPTAATAAQLAAAAAAADDAQPAAADDDDARTEALWSPRTAAARARVRTTLRPHVQRIGARVLDEGILEGVVVECAESLKTWVPSRQEGGRRRRLTPVGLSLSTMSAILAELKVHAIDVPSPHVTVRLRDLICQAFGHTPLRVPWAEEPSRFPDMTAQAKAPRAGVCHDDVWMDQGGGGAVPLRSPVAAASSSTGSAPHPPSPPPPPPGLGAQGGDDDLAAAP